MKRIVCFLMALAMITALCLPAMAEELPTEPPTEGETLPLKEPTQEAPLAEMPEESSAPTGSADTLTDTSEPVVQEGPTLELDLEHRYPGMDKTYQDGYAPAVENGSLRIIVPLLNTGNIPGTIDVALKGLTFAPDASQKALMPQTVVLEDGTTIQNVFLADFLIQVPSTTAPGSYPVKLEVTYAEISQPLEISLPQNIEVPKVEPPTEPSNPTDPTNPPDTSEPTEPTVPEIPTVLEIDSSHIYSGMDMAYEDGYLPRITDGVMQIVLPLKCSGALWDNKLDATVSLDTSAASPFVVENFQKTFSLESVTPKNSPNAQAIYLVRFDIQLTDERKNGTYPVTVNTSGFDYKGNPVKTSFTLYISITDGKVDKPVVPQVDTPTAEPVVYISKTVMEPETVQAGESFAMTVTLKNSITTKSVRNMLVTVDTGNVHITLDEDSNIFPVEKIDAGGEVEMTVHFSTDASIPSGKYPITFSFQYDSSKTLKLSSTGASVVEIQQPANMELVMPRFSDSVSVGETIPISFQVMNMGRSAMYNVRCVVSGYGFAPSNTGYIGTMEAGTSANTKVDLYIIALNASEGNENGSQYGDTTGTVTLIYEDENGKEFSQESLFDTTVKRPVVDISQLQTETDDEETVGQWWISILILGGVILAAGIGLLVFKRKKHKGGAYL